jgi:hypothetical protein
MQFDVFYKVTFKTTALKEVLTQSTPAARGKANLLCSASAQVPASVDVETGELFDALISR